MHQKSHRRASRRVPVSAPCDIRVQMWYGKVFPNRFRAIPLTVLNLKLDMRKRFRGNSASATTTKVKQENASASTTELPGTTSSL